MNYSNKIEEILAGLGKFVPQGFTALRQDVQHSMRQWLQQTLSNMDLVTQEMYQVQTAALRQAQQQLQALEARVTAIEEKVAKL